MQSKIQIINIDDETASCNKCGLNILDINNFKYDGRTKNTLKYREENCVCLGCGNRFAIRYELFDDEGHINQKTFSEDINDPEYNWQDNLTIEQKEAISEHLKNCKICEERLSDEILSDAWFASIIHRGGNND